MSSLESPEDFQVVLDDWGEDVEFRPNENAASRFVRGLVDRSPPQGIEGTPEGLAWDAAVALHNSSATGVSSSELDEGSNQVRIAPRIGGPRVWMSVRILEHTERVIRLGLTGG